MNTRATSSSWGLTVLRLVVGAIILMHGAQKLFHVGFEGVAASFAALQIPLPLVAAVLVTLVEFFGGIALLLGILTRWAAALIALDMLVAVVVVYLEPSAFKGGIEVPVTLLAASIALALSGSGAASLEGLLRKRV